MNWIVYSHYKGGKAHVAKQRPGKWAVVLSTHRTMEDAMQAARAANAKAGR